MSNRVIHFEIHATDPVKTQEFYQNVFNWQFMKWDGTAEYWMITTGDEDKPGINGGMMKRPEAAIIGEQKPGAYVCTVDVTSIDEVLAKVTQHGGTIVMPKKAVTGIGWFSYCKDVDGNLFGVMQQDSSVKGE